MKNFEDRVRFNWGFHDGTLDGLDGRAEKHADGHFDSVYLAGYRAGLADFAKRGVRVESSDEAWSAYAVAA